MKILFPHGEVTKEEIQEILEFAIEGRKRVKDQLMRIDPTYAEVDFSYADASGERHAVKTLEEIQHPKHYYQVTSESPEDDEEEPSAVSNSQPNGVGEALQEKHLTVQENQKGISFDSLFGPYLADARQITITDPYIRLFYQVRNLMELIETIMKVKPEDETVAVHLVTCEDSYNADKQREFFENIEQSSSIVGIHFTWEFDQDNTIHARHIVTDHGWKISLDRGLDIFQHYEMNDAFALENRLQQYRNCKAFEATFLKFTID